MKKIVLCGLLINLLFSGCVMNKLDNSQRTIQLRESLQGTPIVIEITKGENYTSRMEAGPVIFNVLPQIAIWAEDNSGNLIDTLYATGAQFKTFNHAEKDKKQDKFFQEFIPVWSSRVLKSGLLLPSKKNPYPDSITSATPSYSFTLKTKVQDLVLPFTLYLEINKSTDYNQTFTQENSAPVGQPSVIYKAEITEMKPGSAINMKVIGHGGTLHDQPRIYPDLAGLDTALTQIKEIKVRFE